MDVLPLPVQFRPTFDRIRASLSLSCTAASVPPRSLPEELALFMHGWPLLDTFSPVPKGESDGSRRSKPFWNELRGLSVADDDGGNGGCDGRCMKRLQAVKTFLEARSSGSSPRLKWAQVRSCGSVAFHAEFDATAEAIKGMLEEDEGLGFSLLEKEKTWAVNGTFGGD
ncbi:hypothetical protein M407DRAFT_96973 [Tulasnella calospora MUT 4182]|uniref:Uncharacterized protein n=1 Tax=Tulasnella calospora MUT 4182 TaxID=1051891 RepID=A0A0C3QFN1_9AGAM|nr:hypothetical protein M407DRAFT_96973 [Tulasnella calospora MUT 4182]